MEQFKAVKEKATWENVGPTIRFGLACGTIGGIASSFYGLYRSQPHLKLYTYLHFQQYFAYGATFHGLRGYYLHKRPFSSANTTSNINDNIPPTRSDLLKMSTLAGASSGFLINAVFRQRFMISGTLQFALWGYLGQRVWFKVDEWHTGDVKREVEKMAKEEAEGRKVAQTGQNRGKAAFGEDALAKVAEMMGMRRMDDDEYLDLLAEKALSLEAKIALIDERIEEIVKEDREGEGKVQESGESS